MSDPRSPSRDLSPPPDTLRELLADVRDALNVTVDAKGLASLAAIESYVSGLQREIKAMNEMYTEVCAPLQECCQKYKLGLGGEQVHELVIEEVERLRSQVLTPEEAAALIESVSNDRRRDYPAMLLMYSKTRRRMTKASSQSTPFLVTATEGVSPGAFLSSESAPACAAAGETGPAPLTAGMRNQVGAAEGVAILAMRLALVGKAAFPRSVEQVLPLSADEQMVGPHTLSVVAVVADNAPSRDSAVVEKP